MVDCQPPIKWCAVGALYVSAGDASGLVPADLEMGGRSPELLWEALSTSSMAMDVSMRSPLGFDGADMSAGSSL